jgi:hypothetical protein
MESEGNHVTVYKVTGPAFQGHQPGEEFEADLDPDQERRAKARGQLRVVRRGDTKPEQQEEEDDA